MFWSITFIRHIKTIQFKTTHDQSLRSKSMKTCLLNTWIMKTSLRHWVPSFLVGDWPYKAVHVQFLTRKLVFTIIPIARDWSSGVLNWIHFFCFEGSFKTDPKLSITANNFCIYSLFLVFYLYLLGHHHILDPRGRLMLGELHWCLVLGEPGINWIKIEKKHDIWVWNVHIYCTSLINDM